ncbi:hypothetical protein [Aeromicrobium sp. 179-A 4D2 NHS]|uniref:hypothetical protein n=1 Tax=Aeromicrobium sp. 179-A 4D2 NHS TaxID=3142375 RepID=UPI0039A25669
MATDKHGNPINAKKGVQGFIETKKTEATADMKIGALIPDTFEMTEDRQRLLSILTNPDFGGQQFAHGEDNPEIIAETIDTSFPTSHDGLEEWHIDMLASALNDARSADGKKVDMLVDTLTDGDGAPGGVEVGVHLADNQYLKHYLDWRTLTPTDRVNSSGLAAAIETAETIEYAFSRTFGTAKRHGLIDEDDNKTLDWKNIPQKEPITPEDALARAEDNHVLTSVVRVPIHQVIGVAEDDLTENLAAAQVEGGRPFDLAFKILNLDYENGTCDVKVTNDLTEWAVSDN